MAFLQLTKNGPLTVMIYDAYMMPVYHTVSREDFMKQLHDMESPFGTLLYIKEGPLADYAFSQGALEQLNHVNLIVLMEQRKYNNVTLCNLVGYNADSETPQYTADLTPSFTVTLPTIVSMLHYDLPILEGFHNETSAKRNGLVPAMIVSLYMPTDYTYRVTILMDMKTDDVYIECDDALYGPFCGLGNIYEDGLRKLFQILNFHCACFLNDLDNTKFRYLKTFHMYTYDNNKWNIDPNSINEYHAYTFRYLNSLH